MQERDVTVKQSFASPVFYHLLAMVFFGVYFGEFNKATFKDNANQILSDQDLTLIGSIGQICEGVSMFINPTLSDFIGVKIVYFFNMVL